MNCNLSLLSFSKIQKKDLLFSLPALKRFKTIKKGYFLFIGELKSLYVAL